MVCECHSVSDPLILNIWACLQHYNYRDARFIAERVFAENPCDESLYLLATCLYQNNLPKQAKALLLRHDSNSPKCRFLLAKCYMDTGFTTEAENTLLGVNQDLKNPNDVVLFYKEIAPFVLLLLAEIFKMSDRRKFAFPCLKKCLEINPLLWGAYEDIVDMREFMDPVEAFSLPKGAILTNHSCLRALSNRINTGDISHPNCPSKKRSDFHDSQEDLSISRENVNPKLDEKIIESMNADEELINYLPPEPFSCVSRFDSDANSNNDHLNANASDCGNIDASLFHSRHKNYQTKHCRDEDCYKDTIKPMFGNAFVHPSMCACVPPVVNVVSTESSTDNFQIHFLTHNSPILSQNSINSTKKIRSNNKKQLLFSSTTKRPDTSTPINKTPLKSDRPFNASLETPIFKSSEGFNFNLITSSPLSSLDVSHHTLSHHKTRGIISSFNQSLDVGGRQSSVSVDFNTSSSGPRTRSQAAKAAAAQKSNQTKKQLSTVVSSEESNNNTTAAAVKQLFTEIPNTTTHSVKTNYETADSRMHSTLSYLELLIGMGKCYRSLRQYKCTEAIANIKQLPKRHIETALVSSWLAKAYFEINDRNQAYEILTTAHKNEPWQLHGVVLYSSILWKLNKEVALLSLANEMMDMDRESPEVWCVFGNSMSLQRETETAIRFFQRAIQVNPRFAYGFILLGHEYFSEDELEKAMTCFRKAQEYDSCEYAALYGIAMIYQRQENYPEADKTLKDALRIFPDSCYLLTNLAVVRSKLKQYFPPDGSLEILEKTCRLYPKDPLCRFYKAQILFQIGQYQESLNDLKLLEGQMVKEAKIYLLMSLIYKQLGEMSKSMIYSTRATEIDPKCNNESFMLDRSFCHGSSNTIGGTSGSVVPESPMNNSNSNANSNINNNNPATRNNNTNTSFGVSERRNSDSMQDDVSPVRRSADFFESD